MSNPALFSPPDPRAVHRTLALPVALLGALLAHPALLHVSDAVREAERVRGGVGWAAVAACTALISVIHLRLSSRGKTMGSVFTRSVVFGALLGPINSGISLAAVTALKDGLQPNVLGAFMTGTLFGSVAGGCIGFLFGLVYAPLAMAASHHRDRRTYAGPEKARAIAGALIVVAACVHHAFVGGPIAFQAAAALFGTAQIGLAFYRLATLDLFLRAVRRGKEPQWSLAEPRDPSDVVGLLPIYGGHADGDVLYRAAPAEALVSPYRAKEQWVPVARAA